MATADGENERVLEALARLQLSLKELPDKHNPPHLSHWRTLPPAISTAYDYITKGTEIVKATSTKYTLVGKIDAKEGSKLAVCRSFMMMMLVSFLFDSYLSLYHILINTEGTITRL